MSKLEQFDISSKGFLPEECVIKLPLNLEFYQQVFDNLSEAVSSGPEFRQIVDRLPKYNEELYDVLKLSRGEKKFMYSFLSIVCHRYIWCNGLKNAIDRLPAEIGLPWWQVSKDLGLATVLTHAAVDLYNWHLINPKENLSLDNLETNLTMTGTQSESWFYLVMITIEGIGGRLLEEILDLPDYFKSKNNLAIENFLLNFHSILIELTKIIKRMYEKCQQDVFNQIRIYLAGSQNDNLPNGLTIDGLKDEVLRYTGGSAAQSTLIQVYDAVIGIQHHGHSKKFLDGQRLYMPKKHCKYLQTVENQDSLRQYILNSNHSTLTNIYNDCVNQLMKFRQAHLGLIHSYIIKFTGSQNQQTEDKNAHGTKGSGGTNPVEFLADVIKANQIYIIPTNEKKLIEK